MGVLVTTTCPVCYSDLWKVVYRGTVSIEEDELERYSYEVLTGGHHPICRCLSCGVHYARPRDSDSELARMYESGDAKRYIELTEAKRLTFRREARSLAKICGGRGELLEIGCATGVFLEELEAVGFTVHGCDPWAEAVEVAQGRLGDSVRAARFEAEDYEPEGFGAVVAWSVIEHVTDPLKLLRGMTTLLRPGGWLALCTPNFRDMSRRILGPRWHLFERPHLTFFEPATVTDLLEKCGFVDVKIRMNVRVYPLSYVAGYIAKWSTTLAEISTNACAYLPGDGPMLTLPSGSMSVYARKRSAS